MQLAAIARALPGHYASQAELTAALAGLYATQPHNLRRLEALHGAMAIDGRYTALPLADYPALQDFGAANDAFIEVGTELAVRAAGEALERAQLAAKDVGHIFFVSVTGLATPSLDARLVNRLGLSPNIRRTPIFGLGCVAGAAGTARLADSLRAFPDHAGLLVSVELCSLTLQRRDLSVANLVASGLFGDAAAALVMVGARHPLAASAAQAGWPAVCATRAVLYPDTEALMGWRIGSDGFGIVLSAEVPQVVERHIARDVDALLSAHNLNRGDVGVWVLHPGGPKVIDASQRALGLADADVAASRDNLARYGNISSAAVLLMLHDRCRQAPPTRGSWGVMLALGPGFCAELVLLRW